MKSLKNTYSIKKDLQSKAFLFRHKNPGHAGFSVPFSLTEQEDKAWKILERHTAGHSNIKKRRRL